MFWVDAGSTCWTWLNMPAQQHLPWMTDADTTEEQVTDMHVHEQNTASTAATKLSRQCNHKCVRACHMR